MFEMCKVISNGLFTSNKICLNLRQFGIPECEFVKKAFVSMEVDSEVEEVEADVEVEVFFFLISCISQRILSMP